MVLSEKGANSTSDKRISKQTYISDQDDPVALRLSRRIEFITGLATTSKFNVRTQFGTSNIGKSADSFQVGIISVGLIYAYIYSEIAFLYNHNNLKVCFVSLESHTQQLYYTKVNDLYLFLERS